MGFYFFQIPVGPVEKYDTDNDAAERGIEMVAGKIPHIHLIKEIPDAAPDNDDARDRHQTMQKFMRPHVRFLFLPEESHVHSIPL